MSFVTFKNLVMNESNLSYLETLLRETQIKVEKLEDHISDLSNRFPVDLNFKISQIRKLISQAEHKKSFLDDFEEEQTAPEITDTDYLNSSIEKVYNDLVNSFKEIDVYQNRCIDKFIQEHPGPFYIPPPKQSNFPEKRFSQLKSRLQQEKEDINKKLRSLNEKLSQITPNDDTTFSLKLKQLNKDIENQANDMRELLELQSTLKLSLYDAITRNEQTMKIIEADDQQSNVNKENMDALALYKKQDIKIDNTYSTFNQISQTINNDIDEIKSIMKSISLREQSIASVMETYSPIVEKASIKSGQIQESIQKTTTNLETIKQSLENSPTQEMLGELSQKCDQMSEENKSAMLEAKDIVAQTVSDFDKNHYPI